MAKNRQCSTCTACCEGWLRADIEGHQMKPGTPCLHCTDKGCAIYDRRPVSPCREFQCSWVKQDSPLPDHLKPNKCGVIILLDVEWLDMRLTKAIPAGEKIPEEVFEWLLAQARKTGVPLIFTENIVENGEIVRQNHKGYGLPAFIKAVKNLLRPEDIIKF